MKVGILGGHGSIGRRHSDNAWALGHEVRSHDIAVPDGHARDDVIAWADKMIIATPTQQHIHDIIACKTAQKPMLVEKPVAAAWSECLLNQDIMMVGYNLRFHPIVVQVKEAISAKRIGTPLWANFILGQLNSKPGYSHDGVILNWSHEIDLALHLLGSASLVAANIKRDAGADVIADLLLTHSNDCRSTIHLDYVSNPWVRIGTIVGDKGEIYYDLEGGLLDICGEHTRAVDGFDESYRQELQAFLDDDPEHDGCNARQAVAVLSICTKAQAW